MTPSPVNLSEGPWAIDASRLRGFCEVLAGATRVSAPESFFAMPDLSTRRRARREGARAFVSIRGPILRGRANALLALFGVAHTGQQDVADQLRDAADDPSVDELVLEIDSPGGAALGLQSIADAIWDVRKQKTTTAVVSGMAASAAYFLASQAETVVAEADAIVGSIGAFSVVYDTSALLES
ncbi:MAG: S49 family peptidase, partial [Solirubrobacterales bacterium]